MFIIIAVNIDILIVSIISCFWLLILVVVLVVLLDPRLWVEGSYELGSVLLSFRPSVLLSGSFLGIDSLIFSETQHGVRGPCVVVHDRVGFVKKNFFCPKNGENGLKTGQKWGFLDLLKNLVINFFWIWSIKKVHIICCSLALIPYLGKIWFLRYGPKWSRPIRLQDF